MNPSWTMVFKRGVFRHLGVVTRAMHVTDTLMANWRLASPGDAEDDLLITLFDEALDEYGELQQNEFTWRRLPLDPAGQMEFNRLDWIYNNLRRVLLRREMAISTGVIGWLTERSNANELRPRRASVVPHISNRDCDT